MGAAVVAAGVRLLILLLTTTVAAAAAMPWDPIQLNDGTLIPSVAFGTWTLGNGETATDNVDQALETGFDHIDTAQAYRNEEETGTALQNSGLAREDVYITTKFSGRDGLDVDTSIHNSVKYLGVKYVDLYLVHSPRLAVPDIPTIWAQMEKVKSDGLAKSIGVSNFEISDLQTLLASAKVKPVANQILFHPGVWLRQAPLLAYCKANDIVVEAYSALTPLTRQPGGPVDKAATKIANRLGVKPEQVLLAWAKSKGVVVVTSSTKKERLEGYLSAGDLELSAEDIATIEAAGAVGARRELVRTILRRAAGLALVGSLALGACSYLGIDVL